MTVPFALAEGLSGAVNSAGVIVIAGLAGIALRGEPGIESPGPARAVRVRGFVAAAAFGIGQWIG